MTSRIQIIRALSLILIVFMLSCAEEEGEESPSRWIGEEDQFNQDFAIQKEGNTSFILHNKSAMPFDGEIERNSSKHLTIQNFEDGKLNGKSIKKSKDGSWVEANYVNGKLDGELSYSVQMERKDRY
jgi:antitoxin component YwqK of YwqJK toxin-antitoxin module